MKFDSHNYIKKIHILHKMFTKKKIAGYEESLQYTQFISHCISLVYLFIYLHSFMIFYNFTCAFFAYSPSISMPSWSMLFPPHTSLWFLLMYSFCFMTYNFNQGSVWSYSLQDTGIRKSIINHNDSNSPKIYQYQIIQM